MEEWGTGKSKRKSFKNQAVEDEKEERKPR